jgi:hypothetical protein
LKFIPFEWRFPQSGTLRARTKLFVEFFELFQDHPIQSVEHLQLFSNEEFRQLGAKANSRLSHSWSLGKCQPVGQALFG